MKLVDVGKEEIFSSTATSKVDRIIDCVSCLATYIVLSEALKDETEKGDFQVYPPRIFQVICSKCVVSSAIGLAFNL